MDPPRPAWVDGAEYPFEDRYFDLPEGRMHYVDEGTGAPIVMVHGNPMWSFEFRNMIKALRGSYRCIAPDHLGFGLSEKPFSYSYLPAAHAANLERLLESLDLHDATLVVQDWGGPIGLAYALDHPERIRSLVISNTWMWSVRFVLRFRLFSAVMGAPIGRYRIRTSNYFVRSVMPGALGDPKALTPAIHAQYLDALPNPEDRKGSWVFPGQIIGSSEWLASLWARRDRVANKRVLLAWGANDIGFGKKELERWIGLFPQATVARFPKAGHYLPEEDPQGLVAAMRPILGEPALPLLDTKVGPGPPSEIVPRASSGDFRSAQ
jgi:haloalkane dehalogenase